MPQVGSQSAWPVPGLIHLTTPGAMGATVKQKPGSRILSIEILVV